MLLYMLFSDSGTSVGGSAFDDFAVVGDKTAYEKLSLGGRVYRSEIFAGRDHGKIFFYN